MKKFLSVLVAFGCVVVLSSCSLLAPFINEQGQLDARMERIAAAINSHDAEAIKELFSPRALEDATDIDAGLDYFLSFFPNGVDSWESDGFSSSSENAFVKWTRLVKGGYKVSADGKDYYLSLIVFTVNDNLDPENVGVYGLGVIPWSDNPYSVPADAMGYWGAAIDRDTSDPDGYPGVYVGYDNEHLSLLRIPGLLEELNSQDNSGLAYRFTDYARAEYAAELEAGIVELYALIPGRDVIAQDEQDAPTVRENSDNGEEQLLLLSRFRVSSGGVEYWLFCADFRENTIDPSNLGIYAIGAAPWTETEDSPAELALFAWADSFDVDASVPPGVSVFQ
jgi:hypothetical protein